MAEAAIGATIQVVLETVISLAADRIGLFFGFNDELKSLKESATTIQAVLADAEAKQGQDEQVKLWLKRLENVAFEADNVFDELNYEILRRQVKSRNQQQQQQVKGKVCLFFSFSYAKFVFHWRMASKIRDINTKLEKTMQEAIKFGLIIRYQIQAALPTATAGATSSRQTDSVVVPNVVGRANDESTIVEMLLSPSDKVVSVIPIVGMGGMGKTTLAKTVYNNPKIDGHFVKKVWVCVAEKCEGVEIFKLILESLTGEKVELSGKDAIIQKIRKEVQENKYFVVLDDVWNQDQILWDDFFNTLKGLNATNGSWCLVTTRLEEVANTMSRHLMMNVGPYRLGNLPDEYCWSIVKEKAIAGEEVPEELEAIKKQILRRCGGLPLAATLIGSWLLMNRKEEWLSIVQKSFLDNGVEQILKVSFDYLSPTSVKKCFAYCSIFSQDTELEKDQLIELWMAEGFLQPDPKNEKLMEDIGDKYFRILLQSSLLEEVKEWGRTCYKMHDLVHDFAKSALNQDRYLVLNSTESIAEDIIKTNSALLRTLILESNISGDVLSKFECLHVLKLSGEDVKVLSASIGELIHLRVLDISDSEIKILPESLCNLYNLQTLRIGDDMLEECLPKQMSSLISLRHLHYYDHHAEFQMPSKMGQLTHLQTLKFFNVGQEDGCGIEELGTLKDLKGSLNIRNLELVNGKEGAEGAKLFEKPNLFALNFVWCRGDRVSDRCHQNVLEGLQPHPNLQELVIDHFMGDQLPQWFMNLSTLSRLVLYGCKLREFPVLGQLAFLKNLELDGLELRELPALGQLPSLQSLLLVRMRHIRSIGLYFYGVLDDEKGEDRGESSSTSSSCGQVAMSRKFFPALEHLTVGDLENLVEWKDTEEVRSKTGVAEIDLFPMLETLSIWGCSQLTSAPSHFPSIQRVTIRGPYQVSLPKRILSSITNVSSLELIGDQEGKNIKLDKSKLRVENCNRLPSEFLEHLCNLSSFRDLRLESLSNLDLRLTCGTSFESLKPVDSENSEMSEDLSDLECRRINLGQKNLESLEQLSIYHCCGSTSVRFEMLEPWTSLRKLKVFNCPNLVSFPLDLRQTPSLEYLELNMCSELLTSNMPKGFAFLASLKFLRIGPFSDDSSVYKFDWSGLITSSTLRLLNFYGSPHIDSLPDQLQFLTSLTSLELFKFGVEALPDWIGNLTSLEILRSGDCEKLRYLPSMAAMRRLAKLTQLVIMGCPLLQERFNPHSGADSEWPKISHIPSLYY